MKESDLWEAYCWISRLDENILSNSRYLEEYSLLQSFIKHSLFIYFRQKKIQIVVDCVNRKERKRKCLLIIINIVS